MARQCFVTKHMVAYGKAVFCYKAYGCIWQGSVVKKHMVTYGKMTLSQGTLYMVAYGKTVLIVTTYMVAYCKTVLIVTRYMVAYG